ncbi:MAG: DMT family transporter [Thermodesulfobacteriota bacterium]
MNSRQVHSSACGRISPRVKGLFMTLFGAFCFALAPVWVRAIDAYSPLSIVFYRALIAIFPLFYLAMRSQESRGKLMLSGLGRKHLLVLFCIGLSMCGTATTYYLAIMKTTVAKAVLLHYTAPIYVAIFSPLVLKEKNSKVTWFAVGMGILGTALIVEPTNLLVESRDELIGMLSALLSGIFLSGVFLFGRFMAGSLSSLISTFWGCVIVATILLPLGIQLPPGYFWHNLPFLLLLGTVSLALPYTLFLQGQNYISAQASSLAALFEPVCGVAIGFLLYGEQLTLLAFTGALLILVSIYFAGLH